MIILYFRYSGRSSGETKQKAAKWKERGKETLATCARNESVLRWPSGYPHAFRLLPPAHIVQWRLWFQISVFNVDTVLANLKQDATLFS